MNRLELKIQAEQLMQEWDETCFFLDFWERKTGYSFDSNEWGFVRGLIDCGAI